MNLFQRISFKIGLTHTELKVIFFLIVVFLLGIAIKLFNWNISPDSKKNINYSAEDSIFYSLTTASKGLETNKIFDSNQESSDFNTSNFKVNNKKELPSPHSINLNSATVGQLIMLPGVGQKTAENILTYRSKIGGFKKLDDLLNVSGIGELKLEKIKKYIFIR